MDAFIELKKKALKVSKKMWLVPKCLAIPVIDSNNRPKIPDQTFPEKFYEFRIFLEIIKSYCSKNHKFKFTHFIKTVNKNYNI